jgi:hypothetical protein
MTFDKRKVILNHFIHFKQVYIFPISGRVMILLRHDTILERDSQKLKLYFGLEKYQLDYYLVRHEELYYRQVNIMMQLYDKHMDSMLRSIDRNDNYDDLQKFLLKYYFITTAPTLDKQLDFT